MEVGALPFSCNYYETAQWGVARTRQKPMRSDGTGLQRHVVASPCPRTGCERPRICIAKVRPPTRCSAVCGAHHLSTTIRREACAIVAALRRISSDVRYAQRIAPTGCHTADSAHRRHARDRDENAEPNTALLTAAHFPPRDVGWSAAFEQAEGEEEAQERIAAQPNEDWYKVDASRLYGVSRRWSWRARRNGGAPVDLW